MGYIYDPKAVEDSANERASSSFRDHGLNSCSMNDPALASTTVTPEAGKPIYTKIPVRRTTDFSTTRLIVAQAASAEIANAFVAIYNSAGKRLGVSATQATNWQSAGEKGVAVVADSEKSLAVIGGAEAFVYALILLGTQGATPATFRASTATGTVPNFALVANGITLRSGTLGTGKTAAPSEFTPSELTANSGPILLGA